MTAVPFDELKTTCTSAGADAAIDQLIEHLTLAKDYDRLFDALCMKAKHEMGLPLVQPTSFDDVPDKHDETFKEKYVEAARRIGRILLDDNEIPRAWIYFRTIGEHEPVRTAIEAFNGRREFDETTEQLIQVALYEGAHPVKGLEFLLNSHGTCNTITAMDQALPQLNDDDRRRAAAMLVNTIYSDLQSTLHNEVQQRGTMLPPNTSIRELITARDWLFEGANYHIDVSHLNSVVRFSRALLPDDPELPKALELAEYGDKLSDQFQYAGDPPFDDFYPAHQHYFRVILNDKREESLDYFRTKLESDSEDEDRRMVAYVLVDLLTRIGEHQQAVDLAAKYLSDLEDPNGFSFAALCREASQLDKLAEVARQRNDVVTFVGALLSGSEKGSGPNSAQHP
jgi:hypothetical protein